MGKSEVSGSQLIFEITLCKQRLFHASLSP